MAYMQISVRLGRKSGDDAAAVLVRLQVAANDAADEIVGARRMVRGQRDPLSLASGGGQCEIVWVLDREIPVSSGTSLGCESGVRVDPGRGRPAATLGSLGRGGGG